MKVMVISGGSSGIGAAIVSKFLPNHWVYNLDIHDNPCWANQSNYTFLATDVSQARQVEMAMARICAKHPTIDIVIANAGKHLSANIEDTTFEQLQELVQINVYGAVWLIKFALPAMKGNGGCVLTLGSDQSTIAKPNSAVYGMTKAALAHLTKSTALDYAKYNIRANCLAVGTVDTPLYRAAIAKYAQRSALSLMQVEQEEAAAQPLGRIGRAEEVANFAYFLAQDEASYISGALLPIDGGYTVR